MSAPTPEFASGYRNLMVEGFTREVETTKKVFAAIPEDKKDYRRSRARELPGNWRGT